MTRASDLAKLLGAGATINDGTTITTADNTTQLTLTSTDADAAVGPVLGFNRNSASAADSDLLGRLSFIGKNDAGEDVDYGIIRYKIDDASNGTEDADIAIRRMVAGTSTNVLNFKASETIFNEDSADIDFRVESNGNANMLFVDGGNDRVGIGGTPAQALSILPTSIRRMDFFVREAGVNDALVMRSQHATNNNIRDLELEGSFVKIVTGADSGSSGSSNFQFGDSSGNATFFIKKTTESAGTEGLALRPGGGTSNLAVNGGTVFRFCRNTNDGELISFLQANNAEGSISVSGSTVSYNAFSGSHWSRLTDNSKPTILKGTVIETIDEMCDWYQAKFTVEKTDDCPEYEEKISIALPDGKKVGDTISHTHLGITYNNAKILKENDNKHTKCKISDTADSKRVYGVFAAWDADDDNVNDMYVTAVGTHVVRINKGVTVSAGDLLSSNGDGTAKVQDDDIIRSKTIGKVLTNIKQETYSDGSYTVPCALYCG